uniref:Uncharacterized protein n=1 Tax=Trichogramma kaykai TaxID=54128 RepID=A0ABD2XM61_9HYME
MAQYDRSHLKNFQDEHGVSLYLRRVTRVHRQAELDRAYRRSNPNHRLELNFNRNNSRLRDLFDVYDRANYHDEAGLTHLHLACEYGFYEVARELLEQDDLPADPNCRWRETGETPLHLACEWNRNEVAELLLRNGADPNLANDKGETALHAICRKYNDDDFLERCLRICEERGQEVRIDAQDNAGNAPLHLALRYCHKTTIESLLKRGGDRNLSNARGETPLQIIGDVRWIDDEILDAFFEGFEQARSNPVLVDARDIAGRTPLHRALTREHWRMARSLLKAGADPNLARADGETPLHMICKRKSASYVELFFESVEEFDRPLRVDVGDKAGNTPLHYALALDRPETAELLLRRGADPNLANSTGSTALHILCAKYHTTGWTERLFRAMSDDRYHPRLRIDAPDKHGNTALHWALRTDNDRLVGLLLDGGADPNLADCDGSAALHLVCRDLDLRRALDPPRWRRKSRLEFGRRDSPRRRRIEARDKLMRLLLKKGADPNQGDAEGSTPLHVCLKNEDDELVAMFLKNVDRGSFRIDTRDTSGNTPLHLAVHNESREMMKLLLKKGADPNLSDGQGFTPVLSICKGNRATEWAGAKYYDLARVLFEHSRNRFKPVALDGRDESGDTPLHLALRSENRNLVELLLKKGANPNAPNDEASTPIHVICQGYWTVPLLKRVRELGGLVEIDRRDGAGDAPLHHAMRECDRVASEVLLRWGADPNLRNGAGATPLHALCEVYTCQSGLVESFLEICAELGLAETPINARDEAGDSPLHLAVAGGHRLLTELLLRRGADPNLANEEGRTPLHSICKLAWDNDLAEILFGVCDERAERIEIDARDKLGNTPLHLALFRGHPRLTETLLLRGADPTLADGQGRTPAHIVCLRKEYWDDGDLVQMFFRVLEYSVALQLFRCTSINN